MCIDSGWSKVWMRGDPLAKTLFYAGTWTKSHSLSWMDSLSNDLNSHLVESSSSSLLGVSMNGSLLWCKSRMDRFTFLVLVAF